MMFDPNFRLTFYQSPAPLLLKTSPTPLLNPPFPKQKILITDYGPEDLG